jgi:hypothetical protein
MALNRRQFALSTLGLVLAAGAALAGDPAVEQAIGPVQGREGPPYIEATVSLETKYFQQEKVDKLQKLLETLAEKSDMNIRVLDMSASRKMCQMTKTAKPSMKGLAKLFRGSTSIALTVKKNGDIEIKGVSAPPKSKPQ